MSYGIGPHDYDCQCARCCARREAYRLELREAMKNAKKVEWPDDIDTDMVEAESPAPLKGDAE